jgi:hypothetical protein
MEIRGWSLCSGEDGQFKLELGDHFDRNLQFGHILKIIRVNIIIIQVIIWLEALLKFLIASMVIIEII